MLLKVVTRGEGDAGEKMRKEECEASKGKRTRVDKGTRARARVDQHQ